MLTENAKKFDEFNKRNGIELKFDERDGKSICIFTEHLSNGRTFHMYALFNETDSLVTIYGIDIVSCPDESKYLNVYKALNRLNNKYTYLKFVLDDGSIDIESFLVFDNNFNADIVLRTLLFIEHVIETEYEWLRNQIWEDGKAND